MSSSTKDKAAEALAESWASIDGRLERFLACKADDKLDSKKGTYMGYMAEARSMIQRLEARGFTVVPNDDQAGG